MSDSNDNENKNKSNSSKEESLNLLQNLMHNPLLVNIDQKTNYISHLQNQQNLSINNNVKNQANSKSNSTHTNGNINIMNIIMTKISNNDYNSVRELLKNSNIIQQTKNQLLNFSFGKYNSLANNKNQRKIILELVNHGADPNYRLKFSEGNDKTDKENTSSLYNPNIKINPLIYCCIKGDYDLYELLKSKVNLSTSNEENNNNNININNLNKNYFFYFFENNSNMENKYKIASDILLYKKKNNYVNININDYDKESGMTLLMMSVYNQYINFINLFLENEANINSRNLKDGNTALHYAALVKNKEIIKLLLKNDNCNLLIKNNNNETIIDVASNNNCNTEIYALLVGKYTEQQKIFEEKKSQEELNCKNDYNMNISMNNMKMFGDYMRSNNIIKNDNILQNFEDEVDIAKKNQINNNIEELSSYLEIPFQFYNNFNYINHYDSNSNDINNNQNNNIDFNNYGQNNINNNNIGNIRNYLRFKNTPVLNISLKTEEDEDLLILDNLKNENDKYDLEFEDIESRLEQVYNEHNKLLEELSKVNNEIKSINNNIDSYTKQIEEKEKKNINDIKNINMQKNAEKSFLDILLSQENFLNLKNCHEKLLKDEEYLNKKFSEEIFDENQIKANLSKDILDFHLYNKFQIKMKQKPLNSIRSSLQEILEYNGYEYTVYVFGSYATGLCLPWSDLDLILISKNQNLKNNNSILKLKEIVNLLNNINWVDKPSLITDYYAFPFITFSTDEEHGFMKVNLTIQDKKNNGYKCVKITRDFLNSYKNLEPLTLIVKQLMKCSNTLFCLSNYSNNSLETLNSYSILLMIVYFLQIQIMGNIGRTVEMINNPDNLGELFIHFLLYYISDYNEKNYIFVRTGLKDSLENEDYLHLSSFRSKLMIIDPLDHKNNVSLKTAEFRNIQIILKLIYFSSRVKCDCSCHYLKSYNKNNENEKDNDYNKEEDKKFVELGTEHCILKKIFKTALRINSNLLKVFN